MTSTLSAVGVGSSDQVAAGAPTSSGTLSVCYRAKRGPGAGAIQLSDATSDAGLTGPLHGWYGHATAVGDVDGDGWTDLFFGGFADKTIDTKGGRAPDQLLRG